MQEFLQSLSLIDLISEKHKQLRHIALEQTQAQCGQAISEHELYLLTLVHHRPMSISDAGRHMNVSRQAAHKSTKHLIELGYLEQKGCAENRRKSELQLTAQGEALYKLSEGVKQRLQQEVEQKLGTEAVEELRHQLLKEWL